MSNTAISDVAKRAEAFNESHTDPGVEPGVEQSDAKKCISNWKKSRHENGGQTCGAHWIFFKSIALNGDHENSYFILCHPANMTQEKFAKGSVEMLLFVTMLRADVPLLRII